MAAASAAISRRPRLPSPGGAAMSQARVLAAHAQARIVPEFPEPLISASLDNTWHDTAEAVIDNWVGRAYQLTHHDRKLPFQPGIDPADPPGLRRDVSRI